MKKVILPFLLFSFISLQAISAGILANRYLKGELYMEDGSVKSGFIQIPKRSSNLKLNFKTSEESNIEVIKTININYFTVYSNSGEKYSFDCVFLDLDKGADKERVTKYKLTFFVQAKGYANLYLEADEYSTSNDGTIKFISSTTATGEGTPNFRYYVKKRNMNFAEFFVYENPTKIITSDVSRKSLVKSMEIHLPEYPELIEKVRNKEIKTESLTEIFNLYNKFMSSRSI